MDKPYDLVLLGATGFTGQLVAEYLNERYGVGGDLRWAVAGRSSAKLDDLKKSLGADELPTLTADSSDRQSLDKLCQATRVVCTTVGPYAKYGDDLVAACAASGTHYCDLTGEPQWIRRMIDANEAAAQESGAVIVHSCGFDSIPSDLGVYFLQEAASERNGKPCDQVKFRLKAAKGGASGGTAASLMNAVSEARADRDTARALVNPYSLYPRDEERGRDGRDQNGLKFDPDVPGWTGPFVMAGINTKIVRRGNAVAGFPYGRDFRYDEAVIVGRGLGGWMKGAALTAGMSGLMIGAAIPPSRWVLERFVLPDPGEGPNEHERTHGFFNIVLIGKNDGEVSIRVRVKGDRDPGYGSTSKMLGEAAVCLAKDEVVAEGGFWTPASAMGAPLLARLQANAGLTFEVEA
ncbi:MAG: saccharopine dehydrogenase NADP-binding domain-containing protein [Pseudomonadota bacterium]